MAQKAILGGLRNFANYKKRGLKLKWRPNEQRMSKDAFDRLIAIPGGKVTVAFGCVGRVSAVA